MLNEALTNPGNARFQGEATVREVKEKEFSQTSGKPFQRIQLDDGELQRQVKIFIGTGSPLTQVHIGQKLQFSISGYVSTFDNKAYLSGFWNSQAAPQQAPQTPRQGRPAPPQQPNSKKDVDWDGIARGKVRCNVVCAFIQKYGGRDQEIPISIIEYWVDYIMTGQNPRDIPDPDPSIQEPQSGDDIPF